MKKTRKERQSWAKNPKDGMNYEGRRNELSGTSMSWDEAEKDEASDSVQKVSERFLLKCLHLHLKIKRGMKHEIVKLTKKRKVKDW